MLTGAEHSENDNWFSLAFVQTKEVAGSRDRNLHMSWQSWSPSHDTTIVSIAHGQSTGRGMMKRAPEAASRSQHWGVCSSVLDTNPRGVGRGGGGVRDGGASKIFLHFLGIFEFPISF